MTSAPPSSLPSSQGQRRPQHPAVQAILQETYLTSSSPPPPSTYPPSAQTPVQKQTLTQSKLKDDEHRAPSSLSSSVGTKQSSRIRKITQTLAWRSAHVQSPNYSLTIQTTPPRSSPTLSSTPTSQTIVVRQVHTKSDAYGTGATVWPASLVLVKYLEWTREKWLSVLMEGDSGTGVRRRKTVVDLGAGTGVTSLGIALMLSTYAPLSLENRRDEGRKGGDEELSSLVVCTDGCDLVVKLAEENVQRVLQELNSGSDSDTAPVPISKNEDNENIDINNRITSDSMVKNMMGSCEIRVREYNWGDGTLHKELVVTDDSDNEAHSNNTEEYQHYDIILVSDCILPKLYPIAPLVDALDELSGPDTIAYISYEERYYPEYDPKEYFRNLAEAKGFEVKYVQLEEQHPIYSVEDIEIWEVRRRKEE